MKVKKKTILILILTNLILIIGIYLISYNFIMNEFYKIEEEKAGDNIERALNLLARDIAGLSQSNKDWGQWDDTYNFMIDKNSEYIPLNYNLDSLSILNVNDVLIVDNNKKVIFSKEYEFDEWEEEEMSSDELNTFLSLINFTEDNKAGVLIYEDKFTITSIQKILHSGGEGKSEGYLIMARHIDEEEIEIINDIAQLEIKFYKYKDPLPTDFEEAIISSEGNDEYYNILSGKAILDEDSRIPYYKEENINIRGKIHTMPLNNDVYTAFTFLDDMTGKSGIIFRVDLDREVVNQGKQTLNLILLILVGLGFILTLLTYIITDSFILKRLMKLNISIKGITNNNNNNNNNNKLLSYENRYDEISELYSSINEMLREINKGHKDVKNYVYELEKKIKELEKFQELTSDRELKMIELKKQLEELKNKYGKDSK